MLYWFLSFGVANAVGEPVGEWAMVGPSSVEVAPAGVAIEGREAWVLHGADGSVWRTQNAGRSWAQHVVGRGPDSSSRWGLESEARVIAAVAEVGALALEGFSEGDEAPLQSHLDELAAAVDRTVGELQAEAQDGSTSRSSEARSRPRARSAEAVGPPVAQSGAHTTVVTSSGAWLAATEAGPRWSTDQGRSWASSGAGAGLGPCRNAAAHEGVVLLACATGLYRWAPAGGPAASAAVQAEGPPVAGLVRAAQRRLGPRAPRQRRAFASLLPRVSVGVAVSAAHGPRWDVSRWTTGARAATWVAGLTLAWREPARSLTEPGFVLGSTIVLEADHSPELLLASVARSRDRYRHQVIQHVVALARERERLARGLEVPPRASLMHRVAHALRLAEVDAQLDVLTNAAVASWRATTSGGQS